MTSYHNIGYTEKHHLTESTGPITLKKLVNWPVTFDLHPHLHVRWPPDTIPVKTSHLNSCNLFAFVRISRMVSATEPVSLNGLLTHWGLITSCTYMKSITARPKSSALLCECWWFEYVFTAVMAVIPLLIRQPQVPGCSSATQAKEDSRTLTSRTTKPVPYPVCGHECVDVECDTHENGFQARKDPIVSGSHKTVGSGD